MSSSIHLLKFILVVSSLGLLEQAALNIHKLFLCEHIFYFPGITAGCRISIYVVLFQKHLLHCFLEWLNHFSHPLVMYE